MFGQNILRHENTANLWRHTILYTKYVQNFPVSQLFSRARTFADHLHGR
jgi:hypothetical protein